jgi:hypothetical protein
LEKETMLREEEEEEEDEEEEEEKEEEEKEEEELFIFNDTIEGPMAPALKPERITQD